MTYSKPEAVIVDVDGTLADVTQYRHHVLTRPKNFDAFHREAMDAPPIRSTIDWTLDHHRAERAILVVTARMETWREETTAWLDRHVPHAYIGPFMRRDKDYRPDFEIKREILVKIRTVYTVVGAIDDNPNVVRLWESEGIPTTIVPGWLDDPNE